MVVVVVVVIVVMATTQRDGVNRKVAIAWKLMAARPL